MAWNEHIVGASATIAVASIAYLLGCFSSGYYLVRWQTGQDVRQTGSGSTGARNVGRVLGRTGFMLTVLGDVGKGALAVALARFLSPNTFAELAALVAVVLGHLWPVQLRFQGGKGVATSLGGLLIFSPVLTLCWLVLYGAGVLLSRKTVLSGLVAYALLPLAAFIFKLESGIIVGISILAGLILLAHYRNIAEELNQLLPRRLLQPKSKSPKDL